MSKLFSSDFQGIRDIPELPIEAKTTEWEEVSDFGKTTLQRTFSFERHKHLRFFVNEILKTADEMHHHPELVVNSETVQVELYTHDINEVSELDLKLARFIDEIYEDVKFIQEF
jgi:4a-hydroxytetrahydrobiopterin dehydratase